MSRSSSRGQKADVKGRCPDSPVRSECGHTGGHCEGLTQLEWLRLQGLSARCRVGVLPWPVLVW